MPRGSNSSAEVARVKSKEQSDYSTAKVGAGAKHHETVGYHGPRKTNRVKK